MSKELEELRQMKRKFVAKKVTAEKRIVKQACKEIFGKKEQAKVNGYK